MRLAHFSDTHLGFRAFSKTHVSGINQRELDVMISFRATLASILATKPDLVVHSGDLFHVVRPSNNTIDAAFGALMDFQKARDFAPFVLVGGNHDTPKTVEVGNIQKLMLRIPGVRFAAQLAERFDIPELDTEVLCIPSNSLVAREEVALRPSFGRRYSVLSVHGMASQALPKAVDTSHADFDVNELNASGFTYVALGDYHVHSEYAPNCCFSGSTDYTTTNIWEEVGTPKGWVLFDTEVGQLRHIAIPTRKAIDLPVIDAEALSVEEIQERMLANAVFDGDPIVRQKIVNVHPSDRRAIFSGLAKKEIAAKCLNYQVVATAPLRDKGTGELSTPQTASGSIESLWVDHATLASLPASIKTEDFIEAGLELLKEVAQAA